MGGMSGRVLQPRAAATERVWSAQVHRTLELTPRYADAAAAAPHRLAPHPPASARGASEKQRGQHAAEEAGRSAGGAYTSRAHKP